MTTAQTEFCRTWGQQRQVIFPKVVAKAIFRRLGTFVLYVLTPMTGQSSALVRAT